MPVHAEPRLVLVDDTDPSLTYSGSGWKTEERGGLDNIGGDGSDTWLHTAHGTAEDGTVSMSYNGSYIHASATFESVANDTIPSIRCIVDSVEISTNEPPSYPSNQIRICHSAGRNIAEGVHNFTIQIKAAPKKTTIWIDTIAYAPTADVSLENKYITMLPRDRDILYDTSWNPWVNQEVIGTTKIGDSVFITFQGVQAHYFSWIDPVSPSAIGRGSYTVDGGPPTTFTWNTDPELLLDNFLLFTTPEYEYGSHVLKATLLGSTGTLPLTFTQAIIKNGTVPTSNQTDTRQVETSSNKQDNRTVAIVGGVLGGAVFILLLLLLVGFFLLHRRRQTATSTKYSSDTDPTMQPFISPENSPSTISPFSPPTLRPIPIISTHDLNPNINQPPQKLLASQLNSASVSLLPGSTTQSTAYSSDLWSTAGSSNQDSGMRFTADIPPNYTMS